MALIKYLNFKGDSIVTHFISSICAGLCATICSSPFDVVKTRVMNQARAQKGLQGQEIYKNTLDCFIKLYKKEGFSSYYKGVVSYFFRLAPWNIFMFVTYEQYKLMILPRFVAH